MDSNELEEVVNKVIQTLNDCNLKKLDDVELNEKLKKRHGIHEDEVTTAVLQMTQSGDARIEVIDDKYYVHLTTKGLRRLHD